MKSYTILVSCVLFITYLTSCNQQYSPIFDGEEPDITNDYHISESEYSIVNGINYEINIIYEAYCVLRILNGHTNLWVNDADHGNYTYYKSVLNYFGKYSTNDTVKRADIVFESITLDLPPTLVQVLDQNLSVRSDLNLIHIKENDTLWREYLFFVETIQKFCILTDFNKFYEENRSFYRSLLDDYITAQNSNYNLENIGTYYGYISENNSIILEPLQHGGNFGVQLRQNNDIYESYIYIRPRTFINNIPNFFREEGLNTLIHEFSHTYINKLVDSNWNELNKYNYLLDEYDFQKMGTLGYGNPPEWKTIVYEQYVRAATARLTYLYKSELGEQSLNDENDKGFILTELLYNTLIEYENNRNIYPNIDSFFNQWTLSLNNF